MPMKFKLLGGTSLFLGNTQIELPADTDVWFPSVTDGDYDALAGALASNQATFGLHLAALVHDETVSGRDEDGEYTQQVRVSYGAHASRQTQAFGEKTRVVAELAPLPPLTPLADQLAASEVAEPVAADLSEAPTQPLQNAAAVDELPNPAAETLRRMDETDADKIQSIRTLIGVKEADIFNNPTDEALKAKLAGEIETLRAELENLERAQQSIS